MFYISICLSSCSYMFLCILIMNIVSIFPYIFFPLVCDMFLYFICSIYSGRWGRTKPLNCIKGLPPDGCVWEERMMLLQLLHARWRNPRWMNFNRGHPKPHGTHQVPAEAKDNVEVDCHIPASQKYANMKNEYMELPKLFPEFPPFYTFHILVETRFYLNDC